MTGDAHFAHVTAARRARLGLDQRSVALAVGVTQQTVSRWESGTSLPRRQVIPALAQALEYDSADLHRLAGYAAEPSTDDVAELVHALHRTVDRLSDDQVVGLLDVLWRSHHRRSSTAFS